MASKGDRQSAAPGRRPLIRDEHLGYVFAAPALLYMCTVVLLPIAETVWTSFTTIDYRERITEFIGLAHYVKLLTDPFFWRSLWITVVFSVSSTVGHVVLGTAFAMLLTAEWASTRIRNLVRGLLILPWLFSLASATLIWGLLYDPFGPLNHLIVAWNLAPEGVDFLGEPSNAIWSLIVINIWKFYPFYMVIMLGGLQSIPDELYQAARLDGGTGWQLFWFITLPMLRPVLIAATTIDMITTFATFDLVKIMTEGGPQRSTLTLSLYIYETGFRDVNLGYGAAMSVVMLLMLAAATAVYIKLFANRPGGQSGADF